MVSNEEIRRKLAEKRNPNKNSLTEGTVSSDELKKKFKAKRNNQSENPGYLVCDTCGGYYELQSGESPDDFLDECECGGNLKHTKNVNSS